MEKEKNKAISFIMWIAVIIGVCAIIITVFLLYKNYRKDNEIYMMQAVIVRVDEYSVLVNEIKEGKAGEHNVFSVKFAKEGNIGFEVGQQVEIYYRDKMIAMIYPAPLYQIEKIKITKNKSDIEIPIEALRYAYSSTDNCSAEVNEITRAGITFTMTDKNEYPYDYSNNDYSLYKKVKNPNYTGESGYYDGAATSNSLPAYITPEPEYKSVDITEEKKDLIENTVKTLEADSQDENGVKFKAIRKIVNWENILGELEERKI